ncbi:MAG: hypothetical protein JOZ36_14850 [Acidobacteria bacterium]|nr:hypothetical protein [Acidobacteriota bacterium]
MKIKWPGIVAVAMVAIAIIGFKGHQKRTAVAVKEGIPRVVLVADLSEADSADACADIIRSVREARARGIQVEELNSDNKSEMLSHYRVLTTPTVLILDRNGQVVSRFEGENSQTVTAVRTQLAQLR